MSAATGLLRSLAAATLVAAALNPALAAASAFYNETDDDGYPATFGVSLTCGTFCSNNWTIAPGKSAARPGQGGLFVLDVSECTETDSHPQVQTHGFALIRAHSSTSRYWSLYGSDQQLVGNYDVAWRDYPPNRVPSPETCSKGS